MKKIYNLLLGSVMLFGTINSFSQTTVPAGNVYGSWTLAGSPYNVTGGITVPNDSTLTIAAGVTVNFQGHYKFNVQGRVIAIGTAIDSITFTAANTTTGWFGFRFNNTPVTNDTSKFYYCKVLYGKATGSVPDNKGGGFYFNKVSKTIISHSRISNCNASGYGGAICCESDNSLAGIFSINISYNAIVGNSAGLAGGAMWCHTNCCPVINANIFSNNSSYKGGGLCFEDLSNADVKNNIITNNTSTGNSSGIGGGGIYCNTNSDPILTNNTIVNNSAENGGGLFCNSTSNPVLRNCILWGNTGNTAGDQVFLNDEPSDPSFYYCDVQGGSALFELNGNSYSGTYTNSINSNPLFIAPSGGSGTGFNGVSANWSLQNTSPCINTGDPNNLVGFYTLLDKASNPRVVVCRIDMGAYEYQNGLPFLASVTQTASIPCHGYSTGALQVSTTNGTGPYTYTWSPGGITTSTIGNLAAGPYTVTVGEGGGCFRTVVFNLTEPAGMLLTPSQTNINCSGNCIGSASVAVAGGTGPFTYTWTTSPVENTAGTTSTLCSGPYTVTVTDGGGCTASTSVTISAPGALSFSATPGNVSCNGGNNGSINVNATGGTPPLMYSIDNGVNYQLSNNFTGLNANTYSVITKDNSGCQTSMILVTVGEPAVLSATTMQANVRCYGSANGTATVTPSGGAGGYSYTWSPSGGSNAIATNLAANNYTVTVTDANLCSTIATVSIVAVLAPPAICMVTSDSTSTNNIIYWDKTVYTPTSIDSFVIHREVSTGVYKRIGAVSKDSLSMFVDINRAVTPANGDPNVGFYHYKIQVRDSCGTYSTLSPYHTSVYFIDQHNGTFTWNLYDVEFQATPVANFNLMRDSANIGDWRFVGAVAGTTTTLNDPTYAAYAPIGNWRVEATGLNCTPTLRLGHNSTQTAIIRSKSNITNNRATIEVKKVLSNNDVLVYPNPFTSSFMVVTNETKQALVSVYNVIGENVYQSQMTTGKIEIDFSNLQSGVYSLQVKNENGIVTKKIVKQ